MSEMVGAGSYLGSIKSSDVAALFIIALEVSLGLFLMEALGVTRLFPVISTLDDRKRKIILWVSLSFLFVFASIESSLAYMRDMLAADKEALTQMLSGVEAAEPEFRWIPSVGQMVMGFILPFALTFAAIPLESFIHSSRTVIGLMLVWMLNSLSFIIRQISALVKSIGQLIVNVYDLFIFLPLRIEQIFKTTKKSSSSEPDVAQQNMFAEN